MRRAAAIALFLVVSIWVTLVAVAGILFNRHPSIYPSSSTSSSEAQYGLWGGGAMPDPPLVEHQPHDVRQHCDEKGQGDEQQQREHSAVGRLPCTWLNLHGCLATEVGDERDHRENRYPKHLVSEEERADDGEDQRPEAERASVSGVEPVHQPVGWAVDEC